jgi:hypothetical protein
MSRSLPNRTARPDTLPPPGIADVKRIRFVSEAAHGEIVRRRFSHPRPMLAIEQPAEFGSRPMDQVWPESFDELYLIRTPAAVPSELQKATDLWLVGPDHPDAPKSITIKLDSGSIRWRPGRAVLQGAQAMSDGLLAGLIEFAFLEGELRRLEHTLAFYEATAPADVKLAYRVRLDSRPEWERLDRTMEELSRLRLSFAGVEPSLSSASRSLDTDARRIATRLAIRAGIPARLESFSSRLEACEDLYEGAVDRITDFRGWRKGEILEIIIIVLLVVEVIIMIASSFIRLR